MVEAAAVTTSSRTLAVHPVAVVSTSSEGLIINHLLKEPDTVWNARCILSARNVPGRVSGNLREEYRRDSGEYIGDLGVCTECDYEMTQEDILLFCC